MIAMKNNEFFMVAYSEQIGFDKDEETILFTTDNRKRANEIVDVLNAMPLDESFEMSVSQIEDDMIRSIIKQTKGSKLSFRDPVPVFYYKPAPFIRFVEEDEGSEEETEETENASQEEGC